MKRKHSKRIPDDIREKVKIMAIEGHSERYIAKALSISNSEVHRIKKETDNLEQLRADKKRKMAEEIWNLAIRMYDYITDEKLRKTSAAKLTVAMATAIDKSLLLTGEATERVGLGLSMEDLDQRLEEIKAEERELKEAWKRAEEKRKKAAENRKG